MKIRPKISLLQVLIVIDMEISADVGMLFVNVRFISPKHYLVCNT